jgi:WD40 repeat protein
MKWVPPYGTGTRFRGGSAKKYCKNYCFALKGQQSPLMLDESPEVQLLRRRLSASAVSGQHGVVAPVVPDHELIRPIGQGGYGVVWLARNVMGIYRAVKIVYRRDFEDERPFEREFSGIQKFEPLSRSHDGFVDVLHVGRNQSGGYFYYVMELADDAGTEAGFAQPGAISADYSPKTLKREKEQLGRIPADRSIKIGLTLASAMDHLHQNGLVHRDIKPSNIIFVNGQPKLADIGLVAALADARSFVGTEGFIPPEGPGTPQADIYSLGKVLYEISSGKDRHAFPDPPTNLGELPDQETLLELDEVIQRACALEPSQRYSSASRLYEDLVLLQAGKSLKRLRKVERRLAWLGKAALVAGGVAVLAAGAYWFQREAFVREEHLRQLAEMERARAESGAKKISSLLVREYAANGNTLVREGDLLGSLPWFAKAVDLDRNDPAAGEISRLRLALTIQQCPKLSQFCIHRGTIHNGQFSPDGGRVLTASEDGTACIWDATSGEPARIVLKCNPRGSVKHAEFDPDGKRVVTASFDNEARVWDADTGRPITPLLQHDGPVRWAEFSPDGRRVVTASGDATARVWDSETGQPLTPPLRHATNVIFACFSPDGDSVGSEASDGTVSIWDAATGRCLFSTPRDSGRRTISFSPDGRRFLLSGITNALHVWDASSGREVAALNYHVFAGQASFSPDGKWILTGATDRTARIWDATTLQPVVPAFTNSDIVRGVSVGANSQLLAATSLEGTTRVWEIATHKLVSSPLRQFYQSFAPSFSPEGRRLFTVS